MELENTAIRLKRIMQERNLRQVDLLEMVKPFCEKYNVKINKSDISQYLSGKVKPGQEKLSMLSMALGVTESWLMGYDSPKEKSQCIDKLTLSKEETILLENFNRLNDLGKKEANKRVAELSYMPMYCDNEILDTKDNTEEYTLAAHDDGLDEETKKRNLEKAKAMFKQMDEE